VGGRLAGDTTQTATEDTAGATPRTGSTPAAAAGTSAAIADAAAITSPACTANQQFRRSGDFGSGSKQE